MAISIASSFGNGALAPLQGPILGEFGLSFASLGVLTSSFAIARVFMDLPGGDIADRIQPRTIFYAGGTIAVLGVLLTALAPSYPILIAGRVLNGIGSTLGSAAATAYVARRAAIEERGRVLGAMSAVVQMGAFLSPAVVGLFATMFGWRWGFGAIVIPAVMSLALITFVRPERRAKVALAPGASQRRSSPRGWFYSPWPLPFVNITTVLIAIAIFGFKSTLMPLYGGVTMQLDPGTVGLVLTISTGVRFPVSIVAGMVSDRFGRRAVFVPSAVLMAVVVIMMNLSDHIAAYTTVAILYALSGAASPIVHTMVADCAPRERLGAAMGTNAFLRDIGIAGVPLILGVIIDASGFLAASIMLACSAVLAAILGWRLGDTSPRSAARSAQSPS